MDTVNTDLLRGRVDIIVLNALSEKDGYGYDILNYIQTRTQGHYEMKQSSVYSVLKRLEKSGHISSYSGGDETNGAKRRYYSLTDTGRSILENEKKEWSYTRTLLDNLVSKDDFDLKNDTPPFQPSDLRPLTKRVSVTTEEVEESPVQQEKLEEIVENPQVEVLKTNAERPHIEVEKTNYFEEGQLPQSPTVNTVINHSNNRTKSTFAEIFGEVKIESPIVVENKVEAEKISTKPVEKQNINLYKDVLGSIFKAEDTKKKVEQESFDSIDCKYIYDLKAVLKNEGHRLKEYSPMSKSAIKYISFNKLLRDGLLLTFLFYIITVLVLFLARNSFEISKTSLFVLAGLGLIIPIAALLIYYQNPNKKKKDSINLKLIINISLIVYLAAFMITLIVALLVPSGYSLNSLHIYAPCFVMLIIPFFGIIISVLHKSQKYHLS